MASDHRQRHCFYQQRREIKREIWKACAGSLIQTSMVNSIVYYFPEGHIQQASSPVSISGVMNLKNYYVCRVLELSFLADPDTDEVFVKYRLQPLENITNFVLQNSEKNNVVENKKNDVVSFAKVLTPSDANNGGGFSVPRFCADKIFPPLDFTADPPVQKITITDMHGEGWDFRHIYRGTPRRHLLTTGWSKFVNSKKLIAGDSVVFIMDESNGGLFVGIRRAVKMSNEDVSGWGLIPKPPSTSGSGGGFSRAHRGRVPAEAIVEAVQKAENGMEFEVVYYPRAGLPEFVIGVEKVQMYQWDIGMRVKMAQESEDGSRLTWYNGTVSGFLCNKNPALGGPLWRVLKVTWDEPEILQNMTNVSPWQVEFIAPAPPIHAPLPPMKRLKGVQDSELLADREGDLPLPPMSFSSMMGHVNPPYFSHETFPAGMQGARQIPFLLTSLPNINNDSTHKGCPDDKVDSTMQKTEAVSTDLNIGSIPSETPSPDSQNSVHFFSMAATKPRSCNGTKIGSTSFHLFGAFIQVEPRLANTNDISTEYDDSSTKCARNDVDKSLLDPDKKSDDGLSAQRSSGVDGDAL